MVGMCKKISFVDMKKIWSFPKSFIAFSLLMTSLMGNAQHQHFIYLQHEQSAAFYVKYQGQIYRSSSLGYLLLSKIPKGSFVFYLGMDGAGQKEIQFSFDTINADKGFLIKNFGDKGWGLYDLQQAFVKYGSPQESQHLDSGSKIYSDTAVNDAFGNMLSEVTKDTTVKYITINKKEIKKDTIVENKIISSPVLFFRRTETAESDHFIFLVASKSGYDTVSIDIPKENINLSEDSASSLKKNEDALETGQPKSEFTQKDLLKSDSVIEKRILFDQGVVIHKTDSIKSGNLEQISVSADSVSIKSTERILPAVKDSVVIKQEIVIPNKSVSVILRADCKRVADEEGFIRLRKKMAGRRTEEQMIEEALKGFKQNCYTTQQIAQLSGMFMSDEMRYRFFDTSFKYVSDPGQFSSLGKFIQDPYYKKRFEALAPNP